MAPGIVPITIIVGSLIIAIFGFCLRYYLKYGGYRSPNRSSRRRDLLNRQNSAPGTGTISRSNSSTNLMGLMELRPAEADEGAIEDGDAEGAARPRFEGRIRERRHTAG